MGTLNQVCSIDDPGERLWSVAWSPCGNFLVTGGDDKSVRLYSVQSSQLENSAANEDSKKLKEITITKGCLSLEEVQNKTIRSVAFSHNGNYIAAGSFDSSIVVYQKVRNVDDEVAWELIATLEGHENEIKCVAWNPMDTILASCSRDKSIWLWEAPDSNEDEVLEDWDCLSVLTGHEQDVKFVAFSPRINLNEDILVSCSYDDTIRIWKEGNDDWECVLRIGSSMGGHISTVWQIAFVKPNNEYSTCIHFVSCSQDATLKLWKYNIQINEATCFQTIQRHQRSIYSVAVSDDGKYIASAGADDKVCLYSFDQKTEVFETLVEYNNAHSSDINCVRFHPLQPKILVTCGDDAKLKLWTYQC